MVAKLSNYEETRRRRLEENKTRMEALNLHKLSQGLKKPSSPKPSPTKQPKPRTAEKRVVEVRRSSRLTDKPAPVYVEFDIRERMPRRTYKARSSSVVTYVSEEAREEAIEKAEGLQSGLESDFPAFVKSMLPSHVSGGFWLGLPHHFCKKNLPHRDTPMTLITEDGDEYPTLYLSQKSGLSGGWRGFSIANELAYGDALVFQLIRPTAFKVYIVRVNDSESERNEFGMVEHREEQI